MEVEKHGVKGGFFQLFHWKGKSRKKVFSSNSELPETSNQEKENLYGSAISRHQQGHENGFSPDVISQKGYHYASSASGDSEYGTKEPGVVARLMGLGSLPTSTDNEPSSTPFIESVSLGDSSEHDIVFVKSVRNKLEGLISNPLDSRLQKVQSQLIEKFQTEVLPPKSAKPVSTAHRRLLSPIKIPGFVPPKNAAYIIEEAAKIIEQSPRSATKAKLPSLGSSSVPLKLGGRKEKTESAQRLSRSADASQKAKELSSIKHAKKQHSARGQLRPEDSYMYRGSEESKRVASQRSKGKEKSVSLAAQGKVNIQKRDGSTLAGKRSSDKQKEHNETKGSSVRRNIPRIPKKTEKHSSSRDPSEVLKLNHQKQNCASGMEQGNFEPSLSQLTDRKESHLSNSYIHGKANKTVNKIVIGNAITSRKINLVAADPGEKLSPSRTKTSSKNKPPINRNIQSDTSQKAVMKNEKSVKNTVAYECDSEWDTIDKKNDLDIVSFTFRSPLKKSGARSPLGTINHDRCVYSSDPRNSAASSSGLNGNSFSVLLEQKLKEYMRVELSQQDPSNKGLECMENDAHNNTIEYQGRYLHLHGSGSISSVPSSSRASSCSFDIHESLSNESKLPDIEMSDTASLLSITTISENAASSSYMTDLDEPSFWELEYIKDILNSGELMSEEFALGQAHKIITPNLFYELENHERGSNKVKEECFVLERKLLFDCVGECLEVRFGKLSFWARQSMLLHNKHYLAEELYREISSWTNVEDSMVDEIVDKDMSCKNGKWADFEFEAFEEGVEIESRILASLVDEVIDDFFS